MTSCLTFSYSVPMHVMRKYNAKPQRICILFFINDDVSPSQIIQWILWYVPLVIKFMDLTIFVSLIALLGFKFRALNEKIKAITIKAIASPPRVIFLVKQNCENIESFLFNTSSWLRTCAQITYGRSRKRITLPTVLLTMFHSFNTRL